MECQGQNFCVKVIYNYQSEQGRDMDYLSYLLLFLERNFGSLFSENTFMSKKKAICIPVLAAFIEMVKYTNESNTPIIKYTNHWQWQKHTWVNHYNQLSVFHGLFHG